MSTTKLLTYEQDGECFFDATTTTEGAVWVAPFEVPFLDYVAAERARMAFEAWARGQGFTPVWAHAPKA